VPAVAAGAENPQAKTPTTTAKLTFRLLITSSIRRCPNPFSAHYISHRASVSGVVGAILRAPEPSHDELSREA
jgi:hypothetical protein